MIEVKNVTKSYGNGLPAIKNLNMKINDGEFVFVVGASGSGKSTFIKMLLRELKPTEGTIEINGVDIAKLRSKGVARYRRNVGVVFQDFRLLNDRDVYSNITFAQHVIGVNKKDIKKNTARVLNLVGLSEKYRSNPDELSGGEQQRVSLARALVNKPDILLADEPTGNLDPDNAWEIMKLLDKVNEQGTTVIVVTHNMEIVEQMKKRVITLKQGVKINDDKGDK
ncbi:MAG: cell division ATP-binding protein FtsE [Eubacterium sp.]|nr:cell division ATP-binding protein FtsE [Eubacterium sp.]MBR2213870.1 cell division ATP-binding protein FtsE [Eubacterium sp.]